MKYSIGWPIWAFLFLGLAALFGRSRKKENQQLKPIQQNLMGSLRLPLLRFIEAQARHESNYYKSDLVARANNLFGMKVPAKRPTTSKPGTASNGYAVFDSWTDSFKDLLLWMDYTGFPNSVNSPEDYANELFKRGFYTDSPVNYAAGIKRALTTF